MSHTELTLAVREVLLNDWDPCGVGNNEALKDEYDDYLPRIVGLIEGNCPAESINQLLVEFEGGLGVEMPESQRKHTVQALMALSTGPKRP